MVQEYSELHRKSIGFKACVLIGDRLSKTSAEDVPVCVGPAPEWVIGPGGILVENLVLVSLIRAGPGSWVPCIRLKNQKLVT